MFQPFPDRVYNFLKYAAIVGIPAFGALIGTIGITLNWEYVAQFVTIIAAFGTFIGALVGVSSATYAAMQKEIKKEDK